MAGERGGSWTNPFDNIKYYIGAAGKNITGQFNDSAYSSGGAGSYTKSSGTNLFGDPITAVQGASTQQPTSGGASNEPYNETSAVLDNGSASGVGGTDDAEAAGIADATRALNDRETALRDLLGRIGTTKTQGLSKIGDEFMASKTAGIAGYGEQRTDNTRSKLQGLDRVNQKAQTGYRSLKNILGLSGSANQSAARFAVPNAVARVASQDRSGVVDTFGKNDRDIAFAETSFLNDLNRKKADAEYNLEQDTIGQEQDILGQLAELAGQRAQLNGGNYDAIRAAQAGYQTEISNRDNVLMGLFDKYRPLLNTVAQRPELSQFTIDRPVVEARNQGQGDFAPYSQLLRRRLLDTAV